MATVNRYTRLTPSEFNPLSLEEMMMVPLAKQKQQEDLLASQDAIEAELNNLKRLNQDDELVSGKVKDYKTNLDGISDLIAKEGVNRETTRNFRKLYSNYKYDISDSGELGKAQNNYNLAKEREAQSRQKLAQQGHSQSAIDRLIEKTYGDFQGTVNEDGTYNEFGNFGGPGFYDYRKEALDIFSRAKANGISIGKSGSDIEFMTDPSTGATLAKVTNTNLTEEEKENAEQIASAYNSMMTSYSYGDRKEFADLYDLSPQRLSKEFNEMAGAFEFNQKRTMTDSRSSLQVVGKPTAGRRSSTSVSPKGDTWETIPVTARSGNDGADPLGNRLTSDNNLTFRNSMIGFRGGTIKDFRNQDDLTSEERERLIKANGKPGANRSSDGSTEIDGRVLERIFMDPGFLLDPSLEDIKNGARGAGIYTNGNNLTITQGTSGLGHEQLAIEGVYNGEKYNLTIRDPKIVRAFGKYGTTTQGKNEYAGKLRERRKLANDLRQSEPFMASMSDEQILKSYEDSIASRSDYFQNGYKPKNPQNTYYAQSEDLFGKGANLGTIATRKVRFFTEDGTELNLNMKDAKTKDKFANLIYDEDWDDLELEEREEVINQLRNSTDYGLQVGDHEFINPMRRSITDKDGNEIFMMIDNNNELSGKSGEFAGIDDSSELQRYLIEGKSFVQKPAQIIQTKSGDTVKVNQWFVHVPRLNNEGQLEITPLVIYGEGDYNSISDFKNAIDFETLQPKSGYKLHVETQDMVDARVKTNLNKYYDKIANQKTTQTRSDKL